MLQNNTLTHITWKADLTFDWDIAAILDHQRDSLQSLESRCPEIDCELIRSLDSFDFSMLPDRTRRLTHLSVNIARDGTWSLETLEEVAAISTLRSADLWMKIHSYCSKEYEAYGESSPWFEFDPDSCKGRDQFQQPSLNDTSALTLFEHMRSKEGAELKEVTFWVGDWTRPWDGPWFYYFNPRWVEGRRAKVVCRADVGVEMEDWCVIEEGKEYWTIVEHWNHDEL
jgi:hypothetical protein